MSVHGRKLDRYVPDYCVFDLETTGTNCQADAIVEIAALSVRSGRITDTFSTLVNPGCPIPFRASQVNGITDAMVADAPTIDEALPLFLDFAGADVLVGHNIHTFDLHFLYRFCEALHGRPIENDYVDTLPLARRCLPDLGHYKLTDLAAYYAIETDGAHRALADCRMNQIVFERLGEAYARVAEDVKRCPRCGSFLVLRRGKYGPFYGCGGFPGCRYTEPAG